MLLRTEAIVLRTMPYGEADLIVTFITSDFGIKKAFAKSPRKIKSRFGSSLEPLTHANVSFMGKEGAELPKLTQCDIVRPFQGLREGLRCFTLASSMAELLMVLLPEGLENRAAYDLFLNMLDRLERDCTRLTSLLFRVRLLALKGYAPSLSDCGRCGGKSIRFHVAHGAVICDPCSLHINSAATNYGCGTIISVTPGTVKLYEALLTWDLNKTGRLRPADSMITELTSVLDSHVEHIISKPLKIRQTSSIT